MQSGCEDRIAAYLNFVMRGNPDSDMSRNRDLRVLRKDFVDATRCSFCRRPIMTSIAFVLLDPVHGELPAGPKCARRWGRLDGAVPPDLTTGVILPEREPPNGEAETRDAAGPRGPATDGSDRRALEYLLLRFERLPRLGFTGLSFDHLRPTYEAYREDRMTPELLASVRRVMERCDRTAPRLSHEILLQCYTVAHWIDRCLASGRLSTANAERLRSMREQLLHRHWLSPAQMRIVDRELAYAVQDPPSLKPDGFAATTPTRPQAPADPVDLAARSKT